MAHQDEYNDNMVALLELIWGKGYMAPGGPGNVKKLLDGTNPGGKLILDIGCGIGGPAMEMVQVHGAQVVGIDLEAPLVERANKAAREAGLQEHCKFKCVKPGPLAFPDATFDIVVSSGAVTQTEDKAVLFAEIMRVLKPGGHFRCYEWMASGEDATDELRYWIKLEELTYDFQTLASYEALLASTGFTDVQATDASAWYQAEARREHGLLQGDLHEPLVELLGQSDADYYIEDWRAMVVVCESGEMRQGYCRGRRPN